MTGFFSFISALLSRKQVEKDLKESVQEKRAWDEFRKWTLVANQKREEVDGMRNKALTLTVVGAALRASVTQVPHRFGWVTSILGGICLTSVPMITKRYLNPQNISDRGNSRNIAELLRGEVYKSISRAKPYNGKDEDRAAALKTKIAKIRDEHCSPSLSTAVGLIDSDKKAFPHLKDQTATSTWYKDLYLQKRVKKEKNYRRDDSKKKLQLSERYDQVQVFLSTLVGLSGVNGIVSGAMSRNAKEAASHAGMTMQGRLGAAITFITAASLAVTAHVHSSNLNGLAAELKVASDALEQLEEDRDEAMKKNKGVETDDSWNKFVHECEDKIYSQTKSWSDRVIKRAFQQN